MIINYKLYTESLNYKYPYERIIILINGIVDYHSVFDFIENEFDIEINKIRSDETLINTNLIHIALSVPNLYNALNGVFRSIDETDILRFYSTQFNNIDSMLKVINDNVGSYYYNKKDILTLKDLKSIKQLLLYGRKYDFYHMYNKPKENIYESLLNKLTGPTEEDIWNFLETNNKYNPEYYIIDAARLNFLPGVKKGVEELNGDINYGDNLTTAIKNNNDELFYYLIAHGANPSKFCNSSLIEGIINNRLDLVKILIEHGADINQNFKNFDETINPYILSYRLGYQDISEYLLSLGANKVVENENEYGYIHYRIQTV